MPSKKRVAAEVDDLLQPELKAKPDERKFETTESGDKLEVLSISDRIKTVADAIKFGEFDEAVWYVEKSSCTSYECPMKLKADGKQRPVVVKLWRIKLELRRRVTKGVQTACEALIERMKLHAPKYPVLSKPTRTPDPNMLEVSIFDAHFGKLAWAPETGNNYDLEIAESVYLDAVQELIRKSAGFNIERVLFPFGQDFFHIDNLESKTTRGTPQDADGRYAKIFRTGTMACVKAIDYLRQVAPVKLIWVPGNHDTTASYHLGMFLWAWYQNAKDVEICMDRTLTSRRYEAYGPVVVGFSHGDKVKPERLVSVMLQEARELLATRRTLEIHQGHLHKAREMVYASTDTYAGGVRVRTLPSLSGFDAWHYGEGYTGTMRAAEAYLWNKRTGFSAYFSANVNESETPAKASKRG
jgi:hypothetical protein